ncbi:MAG: M1 family aminopeptidase [bacterium]
MQDFLLKKQVFWLSTFLILFCFAWNCQRQPKIEIVEGVSLEIATHRAQTISDVRYTVYFSIPDSQAQPISARESIDFKLSGPAQPLILDFNEKPDKIRSVKISDADLQYEFTNGHIVIPPEALQAGQNTFFIDFFAGESALNRRENFLYTLFVPDRAQDVFPCFDQPNLKAKFKLTLDIPEKWVAVANGKLLSKKTADGRRTYDFAETELLPTYLFSFAAGEFKIISDERNGRKLEMIHRETDLAKINRNTKAIFDLHFKAIEWLVNYTGIPYPFSKFAFVLIPSFQYGGMEHPGAILYRANRLMLDESATQNDILGRASLIAHETAHIWFGDLVTMDWFNDVWMKEVFANFMAAKIANPAFPEINHDLRFLLAHYPSAYAVDRSTGANPIRQKLDNLKDAGSLYGAIIYQKAPIVMRQLERLVGEQAFREALQEYLKSYSFGNATWPQLIEILDQKTSEDLKAWSKVWVSEASMPRVQTEFSLGTDGRQSSLLLKQTDMANNGRIWGQNLSVLFSTGNEMQTFPLKFRTKETSLQETIALPKPDFILTNGDGYGYGYFALDESSRQYLLANAHKLDDAVLRTLSLLSLWEEMLNEKISPDQFLDFLTALLKQESNTQIVQQVLGYLGTVFWQFHTEKSRLALVSQLEKQLWDAMKTAQAQNLKSAYFRAFRNIAITQNGVDKLAKIWHKQLAIPGLIFSENDYTTLSMELAVREAPGWPEILDKQMANIKNPDRKERMQFVRPALSADQRVRDAFFESLKDVKSRHREAWVLTALRYLHHPLRAAASEKYILPSLELVEEIQATGDIFFPKRWLDATLSGHNSAQAAETVREFLGARPDYPHRLHGKILQSADMLFRAAETVNNELL